ncbi:MAG: nicotinate-nicotinamide nucleotide adenylyltransferase [Clostridiaceae bacterium]
MRRAGILGEHLTRSTTDTCSVEELEAYREYGLDEILVHAVSHVPPHKKIIISRNGAARIRMLGLPRNPFRIFCSDFLMGREGEYLRRRLWPLKRIISRSISSGRFLYQLESLSSEQVMAQAVLLVSGRTYEDGGVPLEDKVAYFNEKYNADIRILHNPKIDVASADIRKKAAEGRDLSKDMPAAVAEYIRKTGLYLTK